MADNLLPAALDEIMQRNTKVTMAAPLTFKASAGDVPRLLKAVEAALKHHQPVPLYGNAATDEEPGACPHDPDAQCHFESGDGEWLCELKREGTVCSGCPGFPDGERIPWPCDEYRAILAALTGKEESGG